ncbi:unnamed protein product [Lasius platythorax]|uniref:Secreted protein n=1 Tax=Lasius platythorax TaxID=488582 RepID=A0AAV2N480_9HYME
MSRSWIALGESVLRFHGQIEPMCFIMPDTIACCLSHVTGNFRPTFGFRFVMSSRARAVSPGRFTVGSPSPFPPLVLILLLSAVGDDDHRVSGTRRRDVS